MTPLVFNLLLLLVPTSGEGPFPEGMVVETVSPGAVGALAGFKPGDRLLSWQRAPNGPSDAGTPERVLGSFDLTEIELDHVPRGPVTFRATRAGQPLTLVAPWESLGFYSQTRPAFPEGLLELYERGRVAAAAGKLDEAASAWRELSAQAQRMEGGGAPACWVLARLGSAWASRDVEASARAYGEARACAEKLGPNALAAVLFDQGQTQSSRQGYAQRAEAFRAALEVRGQAGMGKAGDGEILLQLGYLAALSGDRLKAVGLYREAAAALEAIEPESPKLAMILGRLGASVLASGESEAGAAAIARASRIAEQTAPDGPTMSLVLSARLMLADHRGDLAEGERVARRALEIDRKLSPAHTMISQLNLAGLVQSRGDLDGAEDWYRSALAEAETMDNQEMARGLLLGNLGSVAEEKGELALAESYLRRSLQELEKKSAEGEYQVRYLSLLGKVLLERGDVDGAREMLNRALAMSERLKLAAYARAEVLARVASLQMATGELDAAEASYEQARAILERNPFSSLLAHVVQDLGRIQEARGASDKALAHYARAVEILEGSRGRVGSTGEARSLFSSRFHGVYHDYVDALVQRGRVEEAFRVAEMARARGFLTLLAERDLVLRDAPLELEARRRETDAEYERARAELDRLGSDAEAAAVERLTTRVRGLREKQAAVIDSIRQASPHLAEFRDPRPLDAVQAGQALDPGTAFLAYSVGARKTVLFVLTPGSGVETVVIPLGSEALRPRVAAWGRLAQMSAPPPAFLDEARALYDLLIRPAESRLVSARRLVISADGPLHQLPFAALRRNGTYLAEWKPLTFVPSATVLAQLTASRRASVTAPNLVAFGDPRAPDLPELTGSRHEVAAIAGLFPGTRAYLGGDATEEHLKGVGTGAHFVHLAAHGVTNERLPLESALALSPAPSEDGPQGGRLHAWEIFERVRLDADLVTLSACRSAAGQELAGEGVLGLTRAFQYAGARSVMASLWSVPDKSMPPFMQRLYGALKRGAAKDEALQIARVASIRAGHHPVRWAGFQLYGDWR